MPPPIHAEIDRVQFSVLSEEQIKTQAVCEITNTKMYGMGSIYDPLMGSMDQNEVCKSCGMKENCPGHTGFITLSTYVIHPLFYRTVTNLLKCLCLTCYRVSMSRDHLLMKGLLNSNSEIRFRKVSDFLDKTVICSHCQAPKPKIYFQQKTNEIFKKYGETRFLMTDTEVRKIFDNITDEDLNLLGFNPMWMHPRNLVLGVLQVMPPRARPYLITENVTCDDDISLILCDILKLNKSILDDGNNDIKKDRSIQTLKFKIKTMFNNSSGKAKHSNGRPLKGIKERISGKTGLIRQNLMGKRRDQSGRSPISADPTVSTDELVVPRKMAENLTIPERVQEFNMVSLQELVDRGEANYVLRGGARFNLKTATQKKGTRILWGDIIIRGENRIHTRGGVGTLEIIQGDEILRDGKIFKAIPSTTRPFKLQSGDVVERWLRDGDYVLFNRQPTLHKGSLLAKRIKVRDGKTLRFNLASTKSFNADFDGDEMNIFLAQELDARAELQELSSTPHNIMSCQSTKNIICITQDSLLGAYFMTLDSTDMGRDRFFDICMKGECYTRLSGGICWNSTEILQGLARIQKVREEEGSTLPLYCGRTLISLMLPGNLDYTKKTGILLDEPNVIIRRGVLLEGVLSKAILGSAHNSLIHVLFKEYGMDITMGFINNCQFIPNQYMLHRCFSIGISDCVSPISQESEKIAYKCFLEAKEMELSISHPQVRELRVCASLERSREMSQTLSKKLLPPTNSFLATVTSGSRGEMFNLSQIFSMLGQQMHMTHRIAPIFNRGKRTLPCYPTDPSKLTLAQEFESRGFVAHSFANGLSPQEFIWHSVAGREGLTNTSLNTASSGYVMRKLIKCFEDIQVSYGGIVSDTSGNVYNWAYGGDGFDRGLMSVKGGKTYFCDVDMIASRMNNNYINNTRALGL